MKMSKSFKRERTLIISFSSFSEDDEIIENNELEPITKHKIQPTTWSKKRPNNNSDYHYALPNVSRLVFN